MYYVGVDIAKSNHVACITNQGAEILQEAFTFKNDSIGFKTLLDHLEAYPIEDIVIGLESTAHYGEAFIHYFFKLGYRIALINPLQTSAIRKSNIRACKNDKIDSYVIAKSLILNDFRVLENKDINHIQLKSLAKLRMNLVKTRTRTKIQLVAHLDQVFPELATFFKNNLHSNTLYSLFEISSLPRDISRMNLTKLSNILVKASRGKFNKETAHNLKNLASNSIGINDDIINLEVKLAVERIKMLNQQISIVEEKASALLVNVSSVLTTIPGISENAACAILGYIGDIKRFSNAKQLIAFAGLDPRTYQSGNFNATNTRMSKRGNSILRYHLIYSAHNIVKNNELFKQYYDRKISLGKKHYNALGHVATKLLRVIFKMLQDNISFQA
ncbi:MAG: IS110 family transposase [Kangiellaceae bacterium]|jgi:transposase|nr:IS110 family transposase [Kangiellaceae bacterium]